MTLEEIAEILADLKLDLTLAKDPTWYPEERTFNESLANIDRLAKHLKITNLLTKYEDSLKSPFELYPHLLELITPNEVLD